MLSAQVNHKIYLLKCPHREEVSTENYGWCEECDAWVDGEEVGDLRIWWEDSGRIIVEGGGYAPHETQLPH